MECKDDIKDVDCIATNYGVGLDKLRNRKGATGVLFHWQSDLINWMPLIDEKFIVSTEKLPNVLVFFLKVSVSYKLTFNQTTRGVVKKWRTSSCFHPPPTASRSSKYQNGEIMICLVFALFAHTFLETVGDSENNWPVMMLNPEHPSYKMVE